MIIDRLENASLYSNLAPRVTAALAYLRDTDFASTEPGRYDIPVSYTHLRAHET